MVKDIPTEIYQESIKTLKKILQQDRYKKAVSSNDENIKNLENIILNLVSEKTGIKKSILVSTHTPENESTKAKFKKKILKKARRKTDTDNVKSLFISSKFFKEVEIKFNQQRLLELDAWADFKHIPKKYFDSIEDASKNEIEKMSTQLSPLIVYYSIFLDKNPSNVKNQKEIFQIALNVNNNLISTSGKFNKIKELKSHLSELTPYSSFNTLNFVYLSSMIANMVPDTFAQVKYETEQDR